MLELNFLYVHSEVVSTVIQLKSCTFVLKANSQNVYHWQLSQPLSTSSYFLSSRLVSRRLIIGFWTVFLSSVFLAKVISRSHCLDGFAVSFPRLIGDVLVISNLLWMFRSQEAWTIAERKYWQWGRCFGNGFVNWFWANCFELEFLSNTLSNPC